MSHVYLYGPPGVGKSTVGEEVAALMERPFLDLDADIAHASGRSIPELMADGEQVFRDHESAALFRAVTLPPSVIALGGGALLRAANRRCAEEHGRVVCLDADDATLLAQLSRDGTARPLLGADPSAGLDVLLAERREHYRSFATRVRLSDRPGAGREESTAALAREIVRRVSGPSVRLPGGQVYDVLVQPGGLAALGRLLRERGCGSPVLVVSDDTVGALYGERAVEALRSAGFETSLATFPAGERAKTIETVAGLWQAMLDGGLDRTSGVVALGGGVTGDLAGFAAATFMRGVDWVAVPTSLLAMVDASIGGKTGVDLTAGKNLAGCFHQPRLVLIDPDVLATLPDAELRAGLAEVVKHAVIGDPELFALLERGWEATRQRLAQLIDRAVAVKIRVVESDPFERGVRASLNLGHTVGHAVEVASGYALRHGEAVAIGLVAEAALAEALDIARPGLAARVRGVLERLGLPVAVPAAIPTDALAHAMGTDKKRSGGAVRFALPAAIGDVRVGVEVRDLRAALASGGVTA